MRRAFMTESAVLFYSPTIPRSKNLHSRAIEDPRPILGHEGIGPLPALSIANI
jgi:hypothetical protein